MNHSAAIFVFAGVCLAAPAQQPNPPAPPITTPAQSAPLPAQTQQQPQPTPEPLKTVLTDSTQPLNPPAPPPSIASQPSIATVSVEGVSLSGSLSVENGLAVIGNNGVVTSGDKATRLDLTRGGRLNLCSASKIHLSTDNTISGGGLMIAIDHGALEAHYLPGQYSNVILTPDLRVLISGPGETNLSLRVNNQGDTCVDNHGDHAPYVLASSLFEGGAFRVQPNQRVLFEHGSLGHVVDDEKDSCGCPSPAPIPAPTSIARVGMPGGTLHTSDQAPAPPPPAAKLTPAPVSTPAASSIAAQNPFPLAQSEGSQPPPPHSTAVAPPDEPHVQVTVPLVYNGETSENVGMPASSLSAPPSGSAPANNAACSDPLYPGVVCDSEAAVNQAMPKSENPPPDTAVAETPKAKKRSGFVRFLRKVFG